jgi:hypothetical protein
VGDEIKVSGDEDKLIKRGIISQVSMECDYREGE